MLIKQESANTFPWLIPELDQRPTLALSISLHLQCYERVDVIPLNFNEGCGWPKLASSTWAMTRLDCDGCGTSLQTQGWFMRLDQQPLCINITTANTHTYTHSLPLILSMLWNLRHKLDRAPDRVQPQVFTHIHPRANDVVSNKMVIFAS